jgi:hypothetical protein
MSDNASSIAAAISSGNDAAVADWSSGTVPGSNLSNDSSYDSSSPTDSFETYLQSLEKPEEPAAEEAIPPQPESSEAPAEAKAVEAATEEIFVTLEDGRKAKIVADYSDKTKIRKAYEMAAGMRKFQAERDKAREHAKALESETSGLKGTWEKLENAYQNGGIEGLIDLIEGKAGAHKEYLAKKFELERQKELMSPAERAKYDFEEQREQDRRERAASERIRQKQLEEMQTKLAEADEKETRALIMPSFEKYRFRGKLGDEVAEHHFDQAVWMQALTNLEQLDDHQITSDVIDREFARVSQAFSRAAKTQASKATKQAVDTKKRTAKEQAAVSAMQGMNRDTAEQSLTKRLWAGDTAGVLAELMRGSRKK